MNDSSTALVRFASDVGLPQDMYTHSLLVLAVYLFAAPLSVKHCNVTCFRRQTFERLCRRSAPFQIPKRNFFVSQNRTRSCWNQSQKAEFLASLLVAKQKALQGENIWVRERLEMVRVWWTLLTASSCCSRSGRPPCWSIGPMRVNHCLLCNTIPTPPIDNTRITISTG